MGPLYLDPTVMSFNSFYFFAEKILARKIECFMRLVKVTFNKTHVQQVLNNQGCASRPGWVSKLMSSRVPAKCANQ